MLRKTLMAVAMLAYVGCTPANAVTLVEPTCKIVSKASQDVLKDFRDGKTQFEVMSSINKRSSAYWLGSNAAKVYTQVIVIDLMKNVNKAFKDRQILDRVNEMCLDNISKAM